MAKHIARKRIAALMAAGTVAALSTACQAKEDGKGDKQGAADTGAATGATGGESAKPGGEGGTPTPCKTWVSRHQKQSLPGKFRKCGRRFGAQRIAFDQAVRPGSKTRTASEPERPVAASQPWNGTRRQRAHALPGLARDGRLRLILRTPPAQMSAIRSCGPVL